jgi:hypothetical protein
MWHCSGSPSLPTSICLKSSFTLPHFSFKHLYQHIICHMPSFRTLGHLLKITPLPPLLYPAFGVWCLVFVGEALIGFVDKTKARLAPGSCTVQWNQLPMCTSVQRLE